MSTVIKTPRLTLRIIEHSDAPSLSVYGGDYDVARMTGSFPYPFPLLAAEYKIMFMRASHRRGMSYPYVLTQGDHDMMGIVDLFKRAPDSDFELGYWIARPFWGNGYATEAANALISWAEVSQGISRLVASVFEDNTASENVLSKLGFIKTDEVSQGFSMARMKKSNCLNFVRYTGRSAAV